MRDSIRMEEEVKVSGPALEVLFQYEPVWTESLCQALAL